MYKITSKKYLNPTVVQMEIESPLVAAKAKAGQFIILRVDEEGERIPLTIAGVDKEKGTTKIIFQVVGATTEKLKHKELGDYIADFVGPLGKATEIEGYKNVCIIGGGVGCAIALPVAEAFKKNGGNVTIPLKEMLESDKNQFDLIVTIGPLIMMKFVVLAAKPYNVPVTVSMNPIMIDGTGMCGGCRLSLIRDGKRVMKFACVDGPDFNGYEVDFDEAIKRSRQYYDFERQAHKEICNLLAKEAK